MRKAIVLMVAAGLLAWGPVRADDAEAAETTAAVSGAGAETAANPTGFHYRVRRNEAFLKAARKIVRESDRAEADSYLEFAETLSEEATEHYDSGEHTLAEEDISDSTRLAILAITLSKIDSRSIRDIVIAEELALKEMREKARKESAINRKLPEVEVFIRTAEKLLYKDLETENRVALVRLEGAKTSLEAAKSELRKGDVDGALADLDRAYRFATQSVKAIKRSRDEVITFPPPPSEDIEDVYAHELKKNDTYRFFATQVVSPGADEPSELLERGGSERAEALEARESGETEAATEKLMDSTELFIRAIKMSVE